MENTRSCSRIFLHLDILCPRVSISANYIRATCVAELRVLITRSGWARAVVISHWSGSADNHVSRSTCSNSRDDDVVHVVQFHSEASFRSNEGCTLPYADDSCGKFFWKSVSSSWEEIVTYALPSKIRRCPDWPSRWRKKGKWGEREQKFNEAAIFGGLKFASNQRVDFDN